MTQQRESVCTFAAASNEFLDVNIIDMAGTTRYQTFVIEYDMPSRLGTQ